MDTAISKIITRNPIAVNPDTPLYTCIGIMKARQISCLIVSEGGHPRGIYTERDLVKTLHQGIDTASTAIGEVMSSPPICASIEANTLDAAHLLLGNSIRHLVITDSDGELAGILTQTDIIRHLGIEFFLGVKNTEQLMSRNIQRTTKDTSVKQAIRMMAENHAGCVIVLQDERPIGIITERDIAGLLLDGIDTNTTAIEAVMTAPVVTIGADQPPHDAVEIMNHHKIRRLAAVDKQGNLVGVVEQGNIINRPETGHIRLLRQAINERERELSNTRKALANKTLYLESILHSSMDVAIVATDLDMRIVYFNPIAEKLFDYSQEQVHNRTVMEIHEQKKVHPERLTRALKAVRQNGEHCFSFNLQKGDKQHIVEARVTSIADQTGSSIGYTFLCRDITKQKQAESAIHTLMESTAGTTGDAFFSKTTSVMCDWLNADCAIIGKIDRQRYVHILSMQLDNTPIAKFSYHLHHNPCEQVIDQNRLIYHENLDQEFPFNQGIAAYHAHSYIGIPLIGNKGKPIGILCVLSRKSFTPPANAKEIMTIIAARASAELARKRYEERLLLASHVYENAIEGIIVTDAKGHIQHVNPAFSRITGYSATETIGKTPRILKSGRHDQEFYKEMWKTLLATGSWKGEIWNRRKNGEIYPERLTISSVKDANGKATRFTAVFYDITDIKRSEDKIRYQAYHDPLTELPNRLLFEDRLSKAIAGSRRTNSRLAVMFLDIDHFKHLNDSLGHEAGDYFLQDISRQFTNTLRTKDTVARFGGDEFTILIDNINHTQDVITVAKKILGLFNNPFHLKDSKIYLGTSIGIALYPHDGQDAETLIRNADTAMYHAKELGRNNYQFFTQELEVRIREQIAMEAELRKTAEQQAFRLNYQPIVDLQSNNISGLEALLRWKRNNTTSYTPPSEFIPIAEEKGLIIPIGEWVLRKSCMQLQSCTQPGGNGLSISVNLSAYQLKAPKLLDSIKQVLQDTGITPSSLILEITETAMINNLQTAIDTLLQLKEIGIRIALDDFGTGYSSLNYLRQLPVDILKLDHSFIQDIDHDANAARIVANIISLAKGLNLQTIAEGVETREQLMFLKEHGCDKAQGFLFNKPLDEETTTALMRGQ